MKPPIIDIWAVYDHPIDYPDKFIARRWQTTNGEVKPTEDIITADDVHLIRMAMRRRKLYRIPPFRGDDPKIIETWI